MWPVAGEKSSRVAKAESWRSQELPTLDLQISFLYFMAEV